MDDRIVLLSNTYPYSGEPFLKTEMGFLPEEITVDVWPFFADRAKSDCGSAPSKIYPHLYAEPSGLEKVKCLFNSLRMFFREKECRAAFAKKHPARNVLKAIKFAYISEKRLVSIAKWLRKSKSQPGSPLIYAYWMYEVAYVGARLKTENPDCPFLTRCHGYDLYETRHPNGYLPFRNLILKNADLVCPISENGERYLQNLYGPEVGGKTYIARLGTVRTAAVSKSKVREDSIVLVSCSNLVEVKRVHLLIRALSKSNKPIHWYHFGDGELRADLEEQAKALPDHITCTFMGFQANEDIQRFYAEHHIDAFLNVSRSEGVPVSVMEAESYGIPIIATDVGGTSEIVHDRENGVLLAKDFTDQELLAAIDDVLYHESEYSENAIRTWEAMSNADVVFPAFYERLAEV